VKVTNAGVHCPNCGQKDVWYDETDPGDYYHGTTWYCLACNHCFHEVHTSSADTFERDKLAEIRKAAGR